MQRMKYKQVTQQKVVMHDTDVCRGSQWVMNTASLAKKGRGHHQCNKLSSSMRICFQEEETRVFVFWTQHSPVELKGRQHNWMNRISLCQKKKKINSTTLNLWKKKELESCYILMLKFHLNMRQLLLNKEQRNKNCDKWHSEKWSCNGNCPLLMKLVCRWLYWLPVAHRSPHPHPISPPKRVVNWFYARCSLCLSKLLFS